MQHNNTRRLRRRPAPKTSLRSSAQCACASSIVGVDRVGGRLVPLRICAQPQLRFTQQPFIIIAAHSPLVELGAGGGGSAPQPPTSWWGLQQRSPLLVRWGSRQRSKYRHSAQSAPGVGGAPAPVPQASKGAKAPFTPYDLDAVGLRTLNGACVNFALRTNLTHSSIDCPCRRRCPAPCDGGTGGKDATHPTPQGHYTAADGRGPKLLGEGTIGKDWHKRFGFL